MPKEIIYTDHAQERMEERGIPEFKGATVAGQQLLDFIKQAHPFKPKNYYSINKNGGIVFWSKLSPPKKRRGRYRYIYVTTYVEIGVLLIITAFKINNRDYRKYLRKITTNS